MDGFYNYSDWLFYQNARRYKRLKREYIKLLVNLMSERVRNMGVFIIDYGESDGVKSYRVNGSKTDLEKIVNDSKGNGAKFHEEPLIEPIRKGEYTLLLKVLIPVGVGANVKGRSTKNYKNKNS